MQSQFTSCTLLICFYFYFSVSLVVFLRVFCALYGATQHSLSQSFTVGEGAIVSQLLTHFGYRIIDGAIQVHSYIACVLQILNTN